MKHLNPNQLTRSLLRIGFLLSSIVATTGVSAQPSDPAIEREAQALLESAVELMQAKQFPQACRKLETVLQKLPKATGARLELAHCYKGEGRLASSLREYVHVESEARLAGQKSRVAEASKNATTLAQIVGKLQIDVPQDVATIVGLNITLNGETVAPTSWGMAIPVDAMEYEIKVAAPGRTSWIRRIVVRDAIKPGTNASPSVITAGMPSLPGTELRIEIPTHIAKISQVNVKLDGVTADLSEWVMGAPIEIGSHEIAVSAPNYVTWTKQFVIHDGESVKISVDHLSKRTDSPTTPRPSESGTATHNPRVTSGRKIAGVTSLAAGGLTIVAGTIVGSLAISRNQASNDQHCDANDFCDPTGYSLRDSALTLANASTAMFVVGSVLSASGIILIATAPSNRTVPGNPTKAYGTPQTQIWVGLGHLAIRSTW